MSARAWVGVVQAAPGRQADGSWSVEFVVPPRANCEAFRTALTVGRLVTVTLSLDSASLPAIDSVAAPGPRIPA
jgi:hypothetical protein